MTQSESAAEILAALSTRRTARAQQIAALQAKQAQDRDETMVALAAHITAHTGHVWSWARGRSSWLYASAANGWTAVIRVGPNRPKAILDRRARSAVDLGAFATIEDAASNALHAAEVYL